MGKFLITGSPGLGKSTVVRALKRRGYQAFDSESMIGVTKLEDRATGLPAPWPAPPVDWGKYAFNWQEKGLRRLLQKNGDVFIAAAVSNQDLFYKDFDGIFVLTAGEHVIRKRLATRKKKFGKLPDELAGILNYHAEREAGYFNQPHAIAIDANQPLEKIIQIILDHAAATHRS